MTEDLSKLDNDKLDAMIRQAQSAVHGSASTTPSGQPWTPELVQFLTISLLVFGAAVIALMAVLLYRGRDASDILRLFTLPMVITTSVILVILGYSNEQMTPVIGLLGTMVGYILGANRNSRTTTSEARKDDKPTKALHKDAHENEQDR